MDYQIYKLEFQSGVHFGDGGLATAKNVLSADTIFSALCIEAIQLGCLNELAEAVSTDQLRISDGLPYIEDTLYIPKPMVELEIERTGDSKAKKALKKLDYIPVEAIDDYIHGKMNIMEEGKKFHDQFGSFSLIEKAAVYADRDSEPYAVEIFTYGKNSGLYLCVGTESNQQKALIGELLESLGYSGIGGKKNSGYGRFVLKIAKKNQHMLKRLTSDQYKQYITLSVSLPKVDEMQSAVEDSRYKIIKRSGFIESENYAASFRKKKEVYLIASGASFTHRYEGELLDVSEGGRHPVYRYAKPMFLGVR